MLHLTTERLVFRMWTIADYPVFARFFSDVHNTQYLGGVKGPEASWRLMSTYIGHYHLNGFSYLALETKVNKQLVGTVGLWKSTPWPEPELGYWLLPACQGKGFAKEAGIAVKDFAKQHAKINTLVSYISPDNEPSKKLALKLGAKLEKTIQLLDFGKHEVYRYW